MLALPTFILACSPSVDLIFRALRGELPQNNYYDAWTALGEPAASEYQPSEEVRIWVQTHWKKLMPAGAVTEETSDDAGSSCAPVPSIPSTLAIAPAPEPVLSETWMQPFLAEYAKRGVIIQACKAGPVHRDTVQEYRKQDPEFARAFVLAKEAYRDRIRSTIRRRAIEGWKEPVYGRMDTVQDGKVITQTVIVGYIRKHDNRVLLRMAETELEEYATTAGGAKININNSATASASASAAAFVMPAAVLQSVQERNRQQLEEQTARALKKATGSN